MSNPQTRHKRSFTTGNPPSISLKQTQNPVPVYGKEKQQHLIDQKIQESNHLLEKIKQTQWQPRFQYITIPTDQFHSVFLENNPHFQVCINIIKEYNEEIASTKENNQEIRNGPWKLKFNNQLQLLLREIVFTRDRIIQKSFAEKVCSWAIYQLEQLEVAGETQHNQTVESLYAKARLARPDQTATTINSLPNRILSAAGNKSFVKVPKSAVLQNLDKSLLLPQLNTTATTMKPETSFNMSLRPESALNTSKIDIIRPDSSVIFKNIRPDSQVELKSLINRPFSSILKPETTTFIKENKEEDEEEDQFNGKMQRDLSPIQYRGGPHSSQDVNNLSRFNYDLDNEIDRKLYEEYKMKEELKRKEREKIKIDFQASTLQPSQQIEQTLEDYKIKARTIIPDIDPPAQRIKSYTRKKLIPDNLVPNLDQEGDDNKRKGQEQQKVNWTFPKPDILLPSQQQALEEAEQKKQEEEQQQQQQQEQNEQGGTAPNAGEDQDELKDEVADVGQSIIKEAKAEKDKKDVNIVPDVKNYLIDANSKEQFVRNLNNNFEQRSNYVYYEPSNDVREIRMEQKWLQNRNKELNDKRQDEEKIAMLKDWSLAKGRLQKEISRKIESNVYGSQYVQCDYKQRPCSAKRLRELDRVTLPKINQSNSFYHGMDSEASPNKIIDNQKNKKEEEEEEEDDEYEYEYEYEDDVEQLQENKGKEGEKIQVEGKKDRQTRQTKSATVVDMQNLISCDAKTDRYTRFEKEMHDLEYLTSKQKIKQIREMYGNTINIAKSQDLEDERQEVKTTSLSVYAKDRRTQLTNPFSAILQSANPFAVRKQQIQEIQDVKNRLAKYNLSVPFKSMKNAILVPEGHLGTDADLIPEPGYGLFSNPFMKTKKKKKKGKKKSKK